MDYKIKEIKGKYRKKNRKYFFYLALPAIVILPIQILFLMTLVMGFLQGLEDIPMPEFVLKIQSEANSIIQSCAVAVNQNEKLIAILSNEKLQIISIFIIFVCFVVPFLYCLWGAKKYMRMEKIKDSTKTYWTGETVRQWKYDYWSDSYKYESYDVYKSTGGGEYFGICLKILFIGLIFYVQNLFRNKKAEKMAIQNLKKNAG